MKKVLWSLALAAFMAAPAYAQDAAEAPPAPPILSPENADPAFDRYVDVVLLCSAWTNADAPTLADTALQLSEGERILKRPHKSGLTAEKVLGVALDIAAEKKNKDAIARIGKVSEELGLKGLSTRATAIGKLAAASRAPNPALNVSLEDLKPEVLVIFNQLQDDIIAAKVARDKGTLESIEKNLAEIKDLNDGQRAAIKKHIEDARGSLGVPASEGVNLLDKLSGVNRQQPNGAFIAGNILNGIANGLNGVPTGPGGFYPPRPYPPGGGFYPPRPPYYPPPAVYPPRPPYYPPPYPRPYPGPYPYRPW